MSGKQKVGALKITQGPNGRWAGTITMTDGSGPATSQAYAMKSAGDVAAAAEKHYREEGYTVET
jgi:hypothetical protein